MDDQIEQIVPFAIKTPEDESGTLMQSNAKPGDTVEIRVPAGEYLRVVKLATAAEKLVVGQRVWEHGQYLKAHKPKSLEKKKMPSLDILDVTTPKVQFEKEYFNLPPLTFSELHEMKKKMQLQKEQALMEAIAMGLVKADPMSPHLQMPIDNDKIMWSEDTSVPPPKLKTYPQSVIASRISDTLAFIAYALAKESMMRSRRHRVQTWRDEARKTTVLELHFEIKDHEIRDLYGRGGRDWDVVRHLLSNTKNKKKKRNPTHRKIIFK